MSEHETDLNSKSSRLTGGINPLAGPALNPQETKVELGLNPKEGPGIQLVHGADHSVITARLGHISDGLNGIKGTSQAVSHSNAVPSDKSQSGQTSGKDSDNTK